MCAKLQSHLTNHWSATLISDHAVYYGVVLTYIDKAKYEAAARAFYLKGYDLLSMVKYN